MIRQASANKNAADLLLPQFQDALDTANMALDDINDEIVDR